MLELVGRYKGRSYPYAAGAVNAAADDMRHVAQRIPTVMAMSMNKYLGRVVELMGDRHGTPWPGGTTTVSLSRRSGAALGSIRRSRQVTIASDGVEGRIGGIFYLKPHEFGAVIRPKNGKYLTIPLPAALSSTGVPRQRSARQWKDTFVATSKKGNLIIFQKRRGGIVPLYVLKTEVRIPARLKMRETLDDEAIGLYANIAREVLREFNNGV